MNTGIDTVVVVSLGNELRGDDGAGILFGRLIAETGDITVIEGGISPENVSRDIVQTKPDLILIADAAETGEKPGQYRLIDPFGLSVDCLSTHGTTALWCEYLKASTGADIFLIGFQPVSLAFGDPVSSIVHKSVHLAAGQCISLGVAKFIKSLQGGTVYETSLYRVGGRR